MPGRLFLLSVIGVINFIRVIRVVWVIAVIIFVGQYKLLVLILQVLESIIWESLVLPLLIFAHGFQASEPTSQATRPQNATKHTTILSQASSNIAYSPDKSKNTYNPASANKANLFSDLENPINAKQL